MARTPKFVPPPVPARRGRKPKAEMLPLEPDMATDDSVNLAEAVKAEVVTNTPSNVPARGKPGPKPKQPAAAPEPPKRGKGKQPAQSMDQPDAVPEQASAQDDTMIAEMAYPVSAGAASAASSSDTGRSHDAAMPTPHQDMPNRAKSAARWDRAADTVQFDWPEIERTASQDGPNQVMAKLLTAARAEGANSRWPL